MRYLAHTAAEIQSMLQIINQPSIATLFKSIPLAAQLNKKLDLPRALSEIELKKVLQTKAGKAPEATYIGAGATAHFVPELVSQLLLRGEWLTAYTPYQPEVSQGTLQAIFEFQTIVASLYGCDVANASMYDGATAFAEGLLMAARLKPNYKTFLLSRAIHPEYRQVCQTFAKAAGLHIVEIGINLNGTTDLANLEHEITNNKNNIAAIGYQTPNFLGLLEDQAELTKISHNADSLLVATNTDPIVFGIAKSPGSQGADIVTGEGIGLCGHLSLGAPGVGLFATSQKLLRQIPGRLCGATLDSEGKFGFTLTLASREQHIRREKATSNICTNHALMALAFTITMSLYGKTGLQQLAKINLQKTIYFRRKAEAAGLKIAFTGPFFNETVLAFTSRAEVKQRLKNLEAKDIFAGVEIGNWYKEYDHCLLVNTTELHSDESINLLISGLEK